MEHIGVTLGGQASHEVGPLRVLGAVNEVLQAVEGLRHETKATSWQPPTVFLRARSPIVAALVRQQAENIITEANALIKRRFGGPHIERLAVRLTTEP